MIWREHSVQGATSTDEGVRTGLPDQAYKFMASGLEITNGASAYIQGVLLLHFDSDSIQSSCSPFIDFMCLGYGMKRDSLRRQ
jgi:hypothetical protein